MELKFAGEPQQLNAFAFGVAEGRAAPSNATTAPPPLPMTWKGGGARSRQHVYRQPQAAVSPCQPDCPHMQHIVRQTLQRQFGGWGTALLRRWAAPEGANWTVLIMGPVPNLVARIGRFLSFLSCGLASPPRCAPGGSARV